MAKKNLTNAELQGHLKEQISLLIAYCAQFDAGQKIMVKPMATCLRVLLHSKGNNARALLDQLRLRTDIRWRSVAQAGHPRHHRFHCSIIGFHVQMTAGTSERSSGCDPILATPSEIAVRRTPFPQWWTEPIAYDQKKEKVFSRMDIVRHMTDTDGGAHVDPGIDIDYSDLQDGGFLNIGMVASQSVIGISLGGQGEPIRGAAAAAIRTIAHETLLTLSERAPQYFTQPYDWKKPEVMV